MVKDIMQAQLTIKLAKLIVYKSGFIKLNAVLWNTANIDHLTPLEMNIRKDSPTIKYKDEENKSATISYEGYKMEGTVLHLDCQQAEVHYSEYPKLEKIVIWIFDSEDPKKQLVTLKFHEFVQTKLVI